MKHLVLFIHLIQAGMLSGNTTDRTPDNFAILNIHISITSIGIPTFSTETGVVMWYFPQNACLYEIYTMFYTSILHGKTMFSIASFQMKRIKKYFHKMSYCQ